MLLERREALFCLCRRCVVAIISGWWCQNKGSEAPAANPCFRGGPGRETDSLVLRSSSGANFCFVSLLSPPSSPPPSYVVVGGGVGLQHFIHPSGSDVSSSSSSRGRGRRSLHHPSSIHPGGFAVGRSVALPPLSLLSRGVKNNPFSSGGNAEREGGCSWRWHVTNNLLHSPPNSEAPLRRSGL